MSSVGNLPVKPVVVDSRSKDKVVAELEALLAELKLPATSEERIRSFFSRWFVD